MNYPHISIKGRRVKICVEMELQDSMIDCEKEIRKRLNEGGVIATAAALKGENSITGENEDRCYSSVPLGS